ncbi:MAG TPA: HAD hydrolase family protein [Polyangiaceae bacterium]|nr:HAD hydrolase family protein [Polyangiaceae bacterium]
MTRYKLLVTDLDGTLLASDGIAHARDATALRELIDRGVAVSLCPGRMYSGTRHVARDVGLEGPVGCLDGSHVVDTRSDREMAVHALSELATETLLSTLSFHGATPFVFAGDSIFHDESGDHYRDFVQIWSERMERTSSDNPTPWRGSKVEAVVSLGQEHHVREAASKLGDQAEHVQVALFPVSHPAYRGSWGMVVRRAGVTKATALNELCKHYSISLDEVVAVGDWLNDVPMLKAAGRSFAMGQAPSAVKSVATDVLESDTWSGGGIEEAARRAGLL